MTIRAASEDDRAAVIALCRRTLPESETADVPGLQRLLWGDSDSSPAMNRVAECGSELLGCIFGSARDYGDGHGTLGFVKLLCVEPAAQRQDIGSQLLATLEQVLFGLGASSIWAGGSQPHYWWPGVDRANVAATAFLERYGYEAVDETVNMRVLLPAPAARRPPAPGVTARRLLVEDWQSFGDWMTESWGAAWRDEVELTLDRTPVSCFVALEGDEFVGFAAYDTNRRGLFGPMGTSPRLQGKGVGELLLRKCLDDLGASGMTSCVISWVGPRDFYRKTVGATVDREFIRFRKIAPQLHPEGHAAATSTTSTRTPTGND